MREVITSTSLDWGRVVERLCYCFPPVVGVGLVGVLQEAEADVALLDRGLFLVATFGYTALTIAMVTAIALDVRAVRETRQWEPNPWLYGVGALLSAPLVGVVYLYRRHQRFGTPANGPWWWLVVALSLATTLVGLGTAAIGFALAVPGLVTTGVGLAGAIAFGTFPIAIHQDAAYVTSQATSWRPNPGLFLGLAFLSLSLAPLQPVIAAYYLSRRSRAIGLV